MELFRDFFLAFGIFFLISLIVSVLNHEVINKLNLLISKKFEKQDKKYYIKQFSIVSLISFILFFIFLFATPNNIENKKDLKNDIVKQELKQSEKTVVEKKEAPKKDKWYGEKIGYFGKMSGKFGRKKLRAKAIQRRRQYYFDRKSMRFIYDLSGNDMVILELVINELKVGQYTVPRHMREYNQKEKRLFRIEYRKNEWPYDADYFETHSDTYATLAIDSITDKEIKGYVKGKLYAFAYRPNYQNIKFNFTAIIK